MASLIQALYLTLFLLLSISASCQSQCLTDNDNPPKLDPDAAKLLSDARFDFALEALHKISEIDVENNVFFSPHSLYEALELAYFAAQQDTADALKKALHIPQHFNKVDLWRFYGFEKSIEAMRKMNSSHNYDYRVANRLWLSNTKRLRQCMLDLFGDELEVADFKTDPEAMRKRINDWVSNQTVGNIRDLLPTNAIDGSTDAVLANAVYFKGLWQSKFLPENSKRDTFYITQNNFTTAHYMKQKGSFSHTVSEVLGAHVLQLPYKGNDVSMYIILPPFVHKKDDASDVQSAVQPKTDGVRQVLHRLLDQEKNQELRDLLENGMPARDVELKIPKFSLEQELPVKELLTSMGASVVFDALNSDFTALVEKDESGIHLGDAVHKAKIELSEEGTTAAASTALFSFRSSRPTEPAIFNANHPFVYFIYDVPSRSILFSGIFRRPNKH